MAVEKKGILTWELFTPSSQLAMSGDVMVGMAGRRNDGACYWSIEAVSLKHHGGSHGVADSVDAAKARLEEAWASWLVAAGLSPNNEKSEQGTQ